MDTKTFHAPNMLAALQDIQHEFGSDAIVVSVKKPQPRSLLNSLHQPGVEVIAMRPANEVKISKEARPLPPAGVEPKPADETISQFQAELESCFATHLQSLTTGRSADGQPAEAAGIRAIPPFLLPFEARLPEALEKLQGQLVSQGVDQRLVDKAVKTCADVSASLGLKDATRLRAYLKRLLSVGVRTPGKPLLAPPSRMMCIVGSSGSGKTSACAKLASFYGITLGKKVAWIGADTVRAGAVEEARMYCDALNIPLKLVYTPGDIHAALEEASQADLVLVDTPGCNPAREDTLVDLVSLLAEIPNRMLYLAASATTKESDLLQGIAGFRPWQLRGLIATKVDETTSLGNIYNIACRSQIPLTYVTLGGQVVGNLRVADAGDLVEALFQGKYPR
ncbi:MAG: hypothetical protein PHQ40_10560 [Anaerolineaceae bacterium]|nr:hypothetical protein [Anaerolineaceae bacterium]